MVAIVMIFLCLSCTAAYRTDEIIKNETIQIHSKFGNDLYVLPNISLILALDMDIVNNQTVCFKKFYNEQMEHIGCTVEGITDNMDDGHRVVGQLGTSNLSFVIDDFTGTKSVIYMVFNYSTGNVIAYSRVTPFTDSRNIYITGESNKHLHVCVPIHLHVLDEAVDISLMQAESKDYILTFDIKDGRPTHPTVYDEQLSKKIMLSVNSGYISLDVHSGKHMMDAFIMKVSLITSPNDPLVFNFNVTISEQDTMSTSLPVIWAIFGDDIYLPQNMQFILFLAIEKLAHGKDICFKKDPYAYGQPSDTICTMERNAISKRSRYWIAQQTGNLSLAFEDFSIMDAATYSVLNSTGTMVAYSRIYSFADASYINVSVESDRQIDVMIPMKELSKAGDVSLSMEAEPDKIYIITYTFKDGQPIDNTTYDDTLKKDIEMAFLTGYISLHFESSARKGLYKIVVNTPDGPLHSDINVHRAETPSEAPEKTTQRNTTVIDMVTVAPQPDSTSSTVYYWVIGLVVAVVICCLALVVVFKMFYSRWRRGELEGTHRCGNNGIPEEEAMV
ncbi:uncharacterized protein LOC144448322 isoform X2 [Glandiceps talaboti]